ncbi:5-carboxymethyl-2-hydroxymuconate Delta-isomerase [Acinetobacter sp. ANC 4862]|uniref:5-carboxymethyl-2-hydroxymuconate Delta-isomerase n=1 Tax=Acinetobacter sp. ANC 4862 TaxID=2529849 RepID=UPI00103E9AA2|nr:5-carboxymethyl-2-hydroxymuconate Delta-isomerase [Acinetobacter sp. ANC 4862]TCH62959.1 5-carboxymethyl-2-hydroxymuconate Delta-isomerase [Acinetobacter sp. ANC 4862]
MPHIHLEYSDNIENLETKPILLALNKALVEGVYVGSANDVKSRAICQHDYVIGFGDASQAYVHAKVSLLTGRSVELQQEISQLLLTTLEQHLPKQSQMSLQICVEILEMQKATYSKKII